MESKHLMIFYVVGAVAFATVVLGASDCRGTGFSVEGQERLLRACTQACENQLSEFVYKPGELECRCTGGYLIDVD